jgi:PAS domain S-box-containing protein
MVNSAGLIAGSSGGGETESHKLNNNIGGGGGSRDDGNPFLFPSFEKQSTGHAPPLAASTVARTKLAPNAIHYPLQHQQQHPPSQYHQHQQHQNHHVHPPHSSSIFQSQAFQTLNTGLAASALAPGQEGRRVGLLPGIRPELYKRRYEKETKKRRAPREDLSNLTAEEKVERRKARARVYSHYSRKRDEARLEALEKDVSIMQVFQHIVEDAPDMLTVVSPDLDALVLFANEAFTRVLGVNPKGLVGKSLLTLVHPKDHTRMSQIVTEVILAPQKKLVSAPIVCSLATSVEGTYVEVQVKMKRSSQGIICSFWENVESSAVAPAEKEVSDKGRK